MKFDTVSVVKQSVQYGVCYSGFAQGLMPESDGELACDDGGAQLHPVLDDLQKLTCLLG
jgi:hypothetical protein